MILKHVFENSNAPRMLMSLKKNDYGDISLLSFIIDEGARISLRLRKSII